jgi:hypothetical protein
LVTKSGKKLTADGDDEGKGKLVGILFEDYKLSEPFELGANSEWTATGNGNLYLRCQDNWNSIADNSGTIAVKIKLGE